MSKKATIIPKHIVTFKAIEAITPRKEPIPARNASFLSFLATKYSKVNAPRKGPMKRPTTLKRARPRIKPAIPPIMPHFPPPYFFAAIGITKLSIRVTTIARIKVTIKNQRGISTSPLTIAVSKIPDQINHTPGKLTKVKTNPPRSKTPTPKRKNTSPIIAHIRL